MLWMPEKIHIGVINVVRSINKIDIPSIPSWKLKKPEIQFFFSTNWKSGIVESKEYQRKRDRKKFTTEEKIATAEARIKELQLLIEHWKKEGNK